jgi:hypothetical protein
MKDSIASHPAKRNCLLPLRYDVLTQPRPRAVLPSTCLPTGARPHQCAGVDASFGHGFRSSLQIQGNQEHRAPTSCNSSSIGYFFGSIFRKPQLIENTGLRNEIRKFELRNCVQPKHRDEIRCCDFLMLFILCRFVPSDQPWEARA